MSFKLFVLAMGVAVMGGVSSSSQAGEFTDVIDAFDNDNGDPFDLNIEIGYERFQETGDITRETLNRGSIRTGAYYPSYKFGTYEHIQNILNLGVDVGLFRDVSFRFGVPIILSDDRSLSAVKGWAANPPALFAPNFKSPQRSGVDHVTAGLWWSILDQSRIKEYPTLTAFVEGRFAVGKPLTAACVGDARLNVCNGDAFRDGATGQDTVVSEDGGISNNLNQVRIGLHFSRRYGFIEPYMGIDGMFGFYKGTDLTMGTGALNTMPPLEGTFDFGLELIPWEAPADDRKFLIIIGGGATYHSEGRTYTPLFDALGTSRYFLGVNDPNTTDWNPADLDDNGVTEGPDELEAMAAWNGMTDIENFAELFGRLDFAIQPAKYVKFNLGFKAGHKTEHFITKTDQCPMGKVQNGVCTDYNPGHRPVIDEPGSRFRAEKAFVWSLFLDATAQF